MTPFHTAAAADPQRTWPTAIRITESRAALPGQPQARSAGAIETVRAVCGYLRTAWTWLEHKRSQQLSSRRLRVSETISLGEKRTISIVTVDGAQYLIGSSAGGVQLLTRLDQPAADLAPGLSSENERAS
jgi:hypothetical protein